MNTQYRPNPTDKIVIMYHGSDFDGKCSGAIAYNYYINYISPSQITCTPLERGSDSFNDKDLKDRIVVMMDYSLDPKTMYRIKSLAKKFYWIDHHATAIDDVKEYRIKNQLDHIDGLQDATNDVGACGLVYKYFFDPYLPLPVKLLAKYDVCEHIYDPKNHRFMLYFQYGLKSRNTQDVSSQLWQSIVRSSVVDQQELKLYSHENSFDAICLDGKAICKYEVFQSQDKINTVGRICSLYFKDELISSNIFVMNESISNPILVNPLFDKYEIVSIFSFIPGKGYKMSLYSATKHVGEICSKFGGGGHKRAAGFRSKEFPFTLTTH